MKPPEIWISDVCVQRIGRPRYQAVGSSPDKNYIFLIGQACGAHSAGCGVHRCLLSPGEAICVALVRFLDFIWEVPIQISAGEIVWLRGPIRDDNFVFGALE